MLECYRQIVHVLICDLELQQQYTNYKNNLQQLAQRIGDIEQETEEHKCVLVWLLSRVLDKLEIAAMFLKAVCKHAANQPFRLVLETLGPLPPDRKCFRMINGVLVERTIKDVTPALQTNSEGLKKVLEELVKQYKRQQLDMDTWKVCA